MKDFTDDKEATEPRVPGDKVEVIKYFFTVAIMTWLNVLCLCHR